MACLLVVKIVTVEIITVSELEDIPLEDVPLVYLLAASWDFKSAIAASLGVIIKLSNLLTTYLPDLMHLAGYAILFVN